MSDKIRCEACDAEMPEDAWLDDFILCEDCLDAMNARDALEDEMIPFDEVAANLATKH